MKNNKILAIQAALICLFFSVFQAQSPKDSLLLALKNHPQRDTLRCFLLNKILNDARENLTSEQKTIYQNEIRTISEKQLSQKSKHTKTYQKYLGIYHFEKGFESYINANSVESILSLKKALKLHLQSKSNLEIGNDLNYIGINHINTGDYNNAEIAFLKAYQYFKLAKNNIGSQDVLFNLSEIYLKRANYNLAANSLMQALQIAEIQKDQYSKCDIFDKLADLYLRQDEVESAQLYLFKSLNLKLKINYSQTLANSYRVIGVSYYKKNEPEKSIAYFDKAYPFAKNKLQLAAINMTKGLILLKLKRFSEAEKCLNESLKQNETENTKSSIFPALASICFENKKFLDAEKYAVLGFEISKENGYNEKQLDAATILYKIYKNKNQPEKSLQYLEISTDLKDSINKKANQNAVLKADFKYETEKKEASIKSLSQKKKIVELESKRKTTFLLLLGLLFFAIATTGLVLFSRFKTKKQNEMLQNKLVETQNLLEAEKKVTDSELKALKSQMNPHFIFNALNGIQAQFMYGDKYLANEQLNNFTYLTRQILEVSGKKQIAIADEIDILTKYLDLEKMRFKDLTFNITTTENVDPDYHKITPMLLQPFVENSIKHGLMHKKGDKNVTIHLDLSPDENHFICTITDNGIGLAASAKIKEQNKTIHNSFSTLSIEQRLELLNTDKKLENLVVYETILDTEYQEVAGTKVTIKIPLN